MVREAGNVVKDGNPGTWSGSWILWPEFVAHTVALNVAWQAGRGVDHKHPERTGSSFSDGCWFHEAGSPRDLSTAASAQAAHVSACWHYNPPRPQIRR